MLKLRAVLVGILFGLLCASANAHPGHDSFQPVSQSEAIEQANAIIASAMFRNKLHASWADKQLKSATQRDTPNGPVWVIVFHNPGEPDATHATVYVFVDVLGNYLGANFTGKGAQ